MVKFAANLTMLYNEFPFLQRFEAAAKDGFSGVEYLFPYSWPAADLVEQLQANGLCQVLHNLPAGDWEAGERGIACRPDRINEFQDGVGEAIEYATALGCPRINCLIGITPDDVDPVKVRQTVVENLRFAAKAMAAADLSLLIEPINTRDIPGFYLCHTRQALELMAEVGVDNLLLQYDIYHMQVMEGDLAPTIEANLDRIGHLQIADNPGRHEPGTGEINYAFLFDFIDRLGYAGWIGCEYKPLSTTEAGIGWRQSYLS